MVIHRTFISYIFMLTLVACQIREQPQSIATVAAPTPIPKLIQLPLQDDFSDNQLLWATGSYDDKYKNETITVGPDRYILKVQSKQGFINRIYPKNSPAIATSTGFTYSLETKVSQPARTQGAGIAIIDGNSQQGTEFIFLVADDEYEFAQRANRVGKKIIGRTVSSAIKQSGYNKLSLGLRGNIFTLAINEIVVSTIEVDEITSMSKVMFGIVYSQDLADTLTDYEFDNYEIR